MVTSRAVVGSSAMSSFGLAREGYGYHNSLSHTARKLMGILLEALCRLVYADELEQLLCAVMSLFLALAGVQADNLGYLIAYGIDGVEARHGILKDYRNLVAPDFAAFLFRSSCQSDDR